MVPNYPRRDVREMKRTVNAKDWLILGLPHGILRKRESVDGLCGRSVSQIWRDSRLCENYDCVCAKYVVYIYMMCMKMNQNS